MTREEAIMILENLRPKDADSRFSTCEIGDALNMAIQALEQEPCEDAISRQAVIDSLHSKFADGFDSDRWWNSMSVLYAINKVPSVSTKKTGRCKDCQYFQYDSIAIVDGIPLIVAHEICTTWGDGCKTREDGYCFMYTPKVESEDKV